MKGGGPRELREHQRKHPIVTAALLVTTLLPVAPMTIAVGLLLARAAPRPAVWQLVLGAPVLLLAVVAGMLLGGLIFLLIARRFVKREVLEPHYIYPGVPVASR